MNIHTVTIDEVPPILLQPTIGAWVEILHRRRKIYQGFLEVEAKKGYLRIAPLDSAAGQENVRILLMRTLEELLESHHASASPHVLEELVDALNFFLGIHVGVPEPAYAATAGVLQQAWIARFDSTSLSFLNSVVLAFHPLLESLRNRSWQNQVQHSYFMGSPALFELTETLTAQLFGRFSSWEQFIDYYLRKEAVLQFRLETQY